MTSAPAESGPRRRLLLVEDDEDLRAALRFTLEDLGYEIISAIDGDSALALLGSPPRPDVILLDMKLPGRDGRGFLTTLRADPALRSLRVVLMSASEPDPALVELADAFVSKPFHLSTLVAFIEEILSRPGVFEDG